MTIPHPASNHNGGQLQFGPDGMLYIGTGDGGGAGDVPGNAQNLSTRLGKILRIDPHASGSLPYTIPADNPFAGSAGALPEIWSYGLRNPWRFSFDRLTGALLIGDVGQNTREEVDFAVAPSAGRGANFGWNCREGSLPFSMPAPSCEGASGFTEPIYDYANDDSNCAITGGYVARDSSLGDLYGRYLFADACGSVIRSLAPQLPRAGGERSERLEVEFPSSFGEDTCGRLYVASLTTGEVSRFVGDALAQCASTGGDGGGDGREMRCAGEPATRTVAAGGSVSGSAGDDVIVADKRNNKIRSGAGDDLICALGGRDRIRAGAGRDRIRGGHGDDRCKGGPGRDRTRSC